MNFFSIYGEILEAQILRDTNTGVSKGCGFVRFASMTKAEEAIAHITNKSAPVRLPGVTFKAFPKFIGFFRFLDRCRSAGPMEKSRG